MSDICFLITTYNRRKSCQLLVDSLQGIGDIVVVGDAVDYTIQNCRFINLQNHNGRYLYWLTVKRLFSMRGDHKYYFMLPDDFAISESQVREAIEIWKSIDDPQKICLNLYADRIGLKCWTNIYPSDLGVVWRTGWVDMCFMSEDRFFNSIKLRKTTSFKSSGVGAQISRELVRGGYHLYQVKKSLVTEQPESGITQMHNDQNNFRYCERPPKRKRTWDSRRIGS